MSSNTDTNGALCAAALVHTHVAVDSFRDSGFREGLAMI
jgi:hypothetical protein